MTNCPRHPDMPSTDLCVECGDFVCGQCGTVLADRRVLCPSCAERVGVAPPPPVESVAPASWEAPPRPKPRMGYPKYETIEGGRGRKADWNSAAQGAKPSQRATMAMVMGLVGCGCFPAALIALVLGLSELSAIKAGQAPRAGRARAIVGVVAAVLAGIFWIGVATNGK